MMSNKVDAQGRKIADRGNKPLNMDVVKLLKTQDSGYIRTMLQMVRKEREELEGKVVLADEDVQVLRDGDDSRKGKHTVYVGDAEEQGEFDEEEWFGVGADCPSWNRRRKSTETAQHGNEDEEEEDQPKKKVAKKQQEAQELAEKERRTLLSKRARTQERAAAHLDAVRARERNLMTAQEELELQRAKMNSTVGGTNKHGVKFKVRERKR
jgi:U3 small nucleolar RNA-associated protein 11